VEPVDHLDDDAARVSGRLGNPKGGSVLLVSADTIDKWASEAASKADIGWLIRRLIKATCIDCRCVDFYDGSQVYWSGYDGIVECEGYQRIVPAGRSVWELSTDQKVGRKATADFNGRSGEPLGEDTRVTAFVAATARKWAARRDWCSDRRAEQKWREVSAVDAVVLETWLEDAPGIANDFAQRYLDRGVDELRSGDAIWDSYTNSAFYLSGKQLPGRFVIAGRGTTLDGISQWLVRARAQHAGFILPMYGPTALEIAHFVCAAAALLDEDDTGYASSLIWIKSAQAIPALATLAPGHIVLAEAAVGVEISRVVARRRCSAILMHECAEEPNLAHLAGAGRAPETLYLPRASEEQWIRELCLLGMDAERAANAWRAAAADYAQFCSQSAAVGLYGLGRDCK